MKQTLLYSVFVFCCISCGKKQPVVELNFVDSVFNNYATAFKKSTKIVDEESMFWQNRMQGKQPDLVNSIKYAGTLISAFHLTGDVDLIKKSDSILYLVSKEFNNKEASIYLSLSAHYTLEHRFSDADSMFKIADTLGLKNYDKLATAFDIHFEMGRYYLAEQALKKMNLPNDYGYQFRKSKLMHYKGNLDSSIAAMQATIRLAENSEALKQVAQSNLADLYLHNNDIQNAYANYKKCLQSNAADLHSLMGIGWIALTFDNNDSLSQKIFEFAATKTQLPDALFKLVSVAQHKKDSLTELKYAQQFEQIATQKKYGNMYNKYLLQLYTQILNKPEIALNIAKQEITNRATPQTYSWLVYALTCNNQLEKAAKIYNEFVAEKPLEGLELYWMGRFMLAQNKVYNAKQYFKEAAKNKYDLSPRIMNDIEVELK